MSKKSHKKNYAVLDSARVSYDESTDSIHLTAKDKDFEKGDSFHVVLSKGTSTEKTLRKLLNKNGLIADEKVHTFPNLIHYSERDSSNDSALRIPLGVRRDGTELCWDPSQSEPGLAIVGPTGSGKSVVRLLAENHIAKFSKQWDFHGIDLSEAEISYKKTGYGVIARNLDSAQELVEYLSAIMKQRYEKMANSHLTHYSELPEKNKPIMLIIEEFDWLTQPQSQGERTRLKYLQDEINREKIHSQIKEIARLGRSAGVHFLLTAQRDQFDPLLKSNIGMVSFGTASRGRGKLRSTSHQGDEEFQAYYPFNN